MTASFERDERSCRAGRLHGRASCAAHDVGRSRRTPRRPARPTRTRPLRRDRADRRSATHAEARARRPARQRRASRPRSRRRCCARRMRSQPTFAAIARAARRRGEPSRAAARPNSRGSAAQASRTMLRATGGSNAHRGAIWIVGCWSRARRCTRPRADLDASHICASRGRDRALPGPLRAAPHRQSRRARAPALSGRRARAAKRKTASRM